jgi:hypothetical protein
MVDFWDQKGFPGPLRRAIQAYLKLFHVEYKPGIIDRVRSWKHQKLGVLSVESIALRYAFIASFQKAAP